MHRNLLNAFDLIIESSYYVKQLKCNSLQHKLPVLDTKPKGMEGIQAESTPSESSTESSQCVRRGSGADASEKVEGSPAEKEAQLRTDARSSPEAGSACSPASCGKDPDGGPHA